MSTTNAPRPGMFAFWGYDTFPFILHGVVEGVRPEDGYCVIGGGWGGLVVNPLAVLPPDEGGALAQKLAELRAQHRAAVAAVNAGFDAQVAALAPFAANRIKKVHGS